MEFGRTNEEKDGNILQLDVIWNCLNKTFQGKSGIHITLLFIACFQLVENKLPKYSTIYNLKALLATNLLHKNIYFFHHHYSNPKKILLDIAHAARIL